MNAKFSILMSAITTTYINVIILLTFSLLFTCFGKIHELDSFSSLSSNAFLDAYSSDSLTETQNDDNKKHALIFVADRIEELHYVITNDILLRAGMDVRVASMTKALEDVVGINDIMFFPNSGNTAAYLNLPYDIVILCGNYGNKYLLKDIEVKDVLMDQHGRKQWIGAIGDSIYVLQKYQIGRALRIACPFKAKNDLMHDYVIDLNNKVVVDGKLITCNVTGGVMEFAFTIVEQLLGTEVLKNVTRIMKYGELDLPSLGE